MFGRDPAGPRSLTCGSLGVFVHAGKPLWIPPDVACLRWSTTGKSKGYRQGYKYMAQAVADALRRWSDGGALPIVVGAASCTLVSERMSRHSFKGERKK